MARFTTFVLFGAVASFGCAEEEGVPVEQRTPIAFSDRSDLGFSVSEIPEIGRTVSAQMTWRPGSAGFEAEPATGTTPVDASLDYMGGSVVEVGTHVWQLEADLVLNVVTSDGSLDESLPCVLRARRVDFWICEGTINPKVGTFTVLDHPMGKLNYVGWIRRDGQQVMGGVGATVSTYEQLTETSATGTSTGFQAGLWVE
jgi:hypothetical protein